MKILHIIPDLHGGGAQKFCIDLCNELVHTDEVTVCSLFDVEDHMFMARALNPKIELITLNKQLGLDHTIFIKLYHLIQNGGYDVINTHLRALFYASPAIILKRPNTFHTVHNMAHKETNAKSRLIYRMLFRFFNVTPVGISHEVLRSIQDEYSPNYNLLIENGTKRLKATEQIDTVREEISGYCQNRDTKVFLSIGRIEEQKNHRMLVETFNRLLDEGENVILLIIGDDPYFQKPLLTQLKEMSREAIHFLGMKQNIADYLICSDAFCLSSLYEGLPITLLESMSLGVIPICTPAGGIVDVISHRHNGLLSEDISLESFYSQIKLFLSFDSETRSSLSQQGKNDFEHHYNIESTARNYRQHYQAKMESKCLR